MTDAAITNMQKLSIRGLLFSVVSLFLVIIVIARIIVSANIKTTACETFDLGEVIDDFCVSTPWIGGNASVVVARVSEQSWKVAMSRLLKNYSQVRFIDSLDGSIRRVITGHLGKMNIGDVRVFVESSPFGGVVYCIIGRSEGDVPLLFFVVQRI